MSRGVLDRGCAVESGNGRCRPYQNVGLGLLPENFRNLVLKRVKFMMVGSAGRRQSRQFGDEILEVVVRSGINVSCGAAPCSARPSAAIVTRRRASRPVSVPSLCLSVRMSTGMCMCGWQRCIADEAITGAVNSLLALLDGVLYSYAVIVPVLTMLQLPGTHGHQTPPPYRNVSPYGPLRLNMTSSIKQEVHNVSQCHQRRIEPRPQGICTKMS